MYESQRSIFERLNNGIILNNPAAPVSDEVRSAPEIVGWNNEDGLDYRNYYMARTGAFSKIGTDHESAVAFCQRQRVARGEPIKEE